MLNRSAQKFIFMRQNHIKSEGNDQENGTEETERSSGEMLAQAVNLIGK